MARGLRVAGAAREEREEARLLLRVDMVLLDWIDLLFKFRRTSGSYYQVHVYTPRLRLLYRASPRAPY